MTDLEQKLLKELKGFVEWYRVDREAVQANPRSLRRKNFENWVVAAERLIAAVEGDRSQGGSRGI